MMKLLRRMLCCIAGHKWLVVSPDITGRFRSRTCTCCGRRQVLEARTRDGGVWGDR